MYTILTIAGIYFLVVAALTTFAIVRGIRARDNDINHESIQDWERN